MQFDQLLSHVLMCECGEKIQTNKIMSYDKETYNNTNRIKWERELCDKTNTPYGFLNKSGSVVFQCPSMKFSRKEGIYVNSLKTIPVDATIEKREFSDDHITKQQFIGAITAFRNDLTNQIVKHPKLLDQVVEDKMSFVIPKRDRNMDLWSELSNGLIFYEVDLTKAYLQSAYKLGYLSDKYIKRYWNRNELKHALREAVTWLGREVFKTYYNIDKENPNQGYKIECGNPDLNKRIYSRIYRNVRYNLHNTILGCLEAVGFDNTIKYNIDAIYVLPNDLNKVEMLLTDQGWQYSVRKHAKIKENKYISQSAKVRNFY